MSGQDAGWQEVREPGTQKLLCLYDPARGLLWFRRRGVDTLIDLRRFMAMTDLVLRERVNEGVFVREG